MSTDKIQTAIRLSAKDKAAFELAAIQDGLSLTAWLTLAGKERIRKVAKEYGHKVTHK